MEEESILKRNWRKEDRFLYLPGTYPVQVDVPRFPFYVIEGTGSPDRPEFAVEVASLFGLSFGVKMMPKKGDVPDGYYSYQVHPLEGTWDLDPSAPVGRLDRSRLSYRLMMRQPDFLTPEQAQEVIQRTVAAGKLPLAPERIGFEYVTEGPCVQIMHIGPFDREAESFARIDAYCVEQGLERISRSHREIYLSDFRKENPLTFRTVLRVGVRSVRG